MEEPARSSGGSHGSKSNARTSYSSYLQYEGKIPKMLSYEGLDRDNLAKVNHVLESFGSLGESSLNEAFGNILRLSDGKLREGAVTHIVSGTVLHYAISRSGTEKLEELVGTAGLDLEAPCSYFLPLVTEDAPEMLVTMQAVHLAAHQGKLEKLEVLVKVVGPPEDAEEGSPEFEDGKERQTQLLNLHSKISQDGGEAEVHYTPLHLAILGGSENCQNMIEWLLENGACPKQVDHQNTTPLHLLCFLGFPPELLEIDNDVVKGIVENMLEKGAPLTVQSHSHYWALEGSSGSTPLDLSVHPGSQFPTELIFLLSPAFEHAMTPSTTSWNLNEPDFFEEILKVVSSTRQGAIHFAQAGKGEDRTGQVWLDAANRSTSIRGLSILMFRCPEAANLVLETLCNNDCAPDVMDIYTHPLPTLMDFEETSFAGRLIAWEFRCAYNTDTIDNYYQPLNPKPKITIPWPQWQSKPEAQVWHEEFAPAQPSRKSVPKDCKIKISIMPNLIHLDMFWALANVPDDQIKVMGEETIQALVTCVWSNVVWKVHMVDLVTTMGAIALLWYWGVYNREIGVESAPPMHHSFLWSCLLALVMRDFLEILEWIWQYQRRRVLARKEEDQFSTHNIGPQMWSFENFYRLASIGQDVFNMGLRLALLIFATFVPNPTLWSTSGDVAVVLISINIAFAFIKLMRLFQMIGSVGLNIVAVLSSLLSGRMPQMLMVSTLVLLMFVAIFNVLIRNQTTYYMFLYLYRGLIFGDGDGLDFLGMKTDFTDSAMPEPNEQAFHAVTKGGFMTFATVIFNIVILNLVIAVYGNEYESMVEKSEGIFTRMRAMYTAKYLMLSTTMEGATSVSTLFMERLHLLHFGYTLSFLMITGSLAWLKYWDVVSYVAAFLIAFGLLLLRERIMATQKDWFDENKRFYLWWCRPDEFDKDRFKSKDEHEDEKNDKLDEMTSSVDRLDSELQNSGSGMEFKKLNGRVTHLDKQLQKVTKGLLLLRKMNLASKRPSTLD